MFQERLDASDEAQGMREGRVKFESTLILPTRVHVELAAVADRLERLIAEAADFSASGGLNVCDGLSQLLLAAGPGMQTGEQEQLHVTLRIGPPTGFGAYETDDAQRFARAATAGTRNRREDVRFYEDFFVKPLCWWLRMTMPQGGLAV